MNNLLICKGKSRNSCSFLAFLLFTFLLVAPTAAQTLKENNITLRVQNEPVENVFNKISEQTNFKFIYDQETVNNAPHVSFDVKNATLKQILGVITTQSKLYFNRTDNTIAVSKQPLKEESAQRTRTVQGVVVDDKGEPVIGASVQIKGCLLYTFPSPRDRQKSRMPSSACKNKKKNTYIRTISHSKIRTTS